MTLAATAKIKENRKQAILVAALNCFLQFGYVKTSMNDVAKEASLSRPLIYSKFKNKEDLYIGVIEHLAEGRFETAEKILGSNESAKDKLMGIYEIFLLEPWEKIIGKPMTADFYKVYNNLFQELAEKYKHKSLKSTQAVLKESKLSELFILAVEGLKSDLPNTQTLRNRLKMLVEQFVS